MRATSVSVRTGTESARAGAGLLVDPILVGGRRSTKSLVAAGAIAVALGLALAKPWLSVAAPVAPDRSVEAAVVASQSTRASTVEGVRALESSGAARIRSATRAIRPADWPRLVADADHFAGQPIVTDRDLGGTDGDGTCGGSARITPFDELFAILTPPGERVSDVRLFAIDSIRRPDVPTRVLSDRPGPLDDRVRGGLTVVVLPAGGIAARQYALIADTTSTAGRGRLTYTICVG